jgi:hypothetical protein
MREAFTVAWAVGLTPTQWRVLAGVMNETACWARVGKRIWVASLAATVNIVGENGRARPNDVKRVARALRELRDLGIIDYDPSRKSGEKSWISIVPPTPKLGADSNPLVEESESTLSVDTDSPKRREESNGCGNTSAPTPENLLPPQSQKASSPRGESAAAPVPHDADPDVDDDPFEPDIGDADVEPEFDRDDDDAR